MPDTVKRTIRVTTKQHVLAEEKPVQEGFPVRQWSIEIHALNQDGEVVPADFFDRVTYKLHPTFAQPIRTVKTPPFLIEERGWGEFDVGITMHAAETGSDRSADKQISHDLNFAQTEYSIDHTVSFNNPSPGLIALLQRSGPVTTQTSTKRSGSDLEDKSKVKKPRIAEKGNVNLEKLARGLEKISEDHLLNVVQMVTDNKTPDMFVENDPEAGEFRMDLCTLPDPLLKSLWEYVKKHAEV